jgi:hypothetical protein
MSTVPAVQCVLCRYKVYLSPLPNAVEDVSIGKDPDVEVGCEDTVKGANFFIPAIEVGKQD